MSLADLIAEVEKLTGPSREVDARTAEMFDLPRCHLPDCYPDLFVRIIARVKAGGDDKTDIPAYTASIDAVVALIERELHPEHPCMTVSLRGVYSGADKWWKAEITWPSYERHGRGTSEAGALLAAFLRAIEARAR